MFRSTTIIRELVCVLCSAQHTVHMPHWDMLPHHRITINDITLLNVFISI